MQDKEKIYSLDLMHNGTPAPFVIKTMEEIDEALGGIADTPHKHNYYTVIWPTGATGRHIIDFREYPIRRDHIFFVSPGQVHQIITDQGPTGFVILFSPEFLEKNSIRKDFISDLNLFRQSDETPPLPVSPEKAATLKYFTDRMREAFHNQYDMHLEAIGAYLKLFLIECNSHCNLPVETNTQSIETGKTLIRNFRELVEKNFPRWHQVQDYASALFVTPSYLNDVMRTAMDIPAKEFIRNKLILEAKRMAVFTEKSSKEIGFELGFEDPSHFSKFFRKNTGLSFQAFRKTL